MSDQGSIDFAELTVLAAVATLSDELDDVFVATSKVLSRVEDAIGIGPRYGYPLLLDLGARWKINLALVSIRGQGGDRGEYRPSPDFNLTCLTGVGRLIADAKLGLSARDLVRLINGTMYRGGTRPPLDPTRVIAALRELLPDIQTPDREIYEIIGPPCFANPCEITGDFASVYEGEKAVIRQTGRITNLSYPPPRTGRRHQVSDKAEQLSARAGASAKQARAGLLISSLPDDTGIEHFLQNLERHSGISRKNPRSVSPNWKGRLPVAEISNLSEDDEVRIEVMLSPESDAEDAARRIAALDGIYAELTAQLPASLAAMLRSWVKGLSQRDAADILHALEDAIAQDSQHSEC